IIGSLPHGMTRLGASVLFFAYDTVHGDALWRTDGTEAGTVLVKDIRAGTDPLFGRELTICGGNALFAADDGVHGSELWKTDGTEAGTALVADINPGARGSLPTLLTNVNGVLFFVANDGVHGTELWKFDGHDTTLVKELVAGSGGPDFLALTAVGGTLIGTA